ncbi:MAG TPA: hypothetical protein VHJ58_11895 [Vicinamibacterales bacterium]|jgi:hypothetical protein|nr:hypothetical protein [Vicinamibacterales bacterium]
MKIWWAVAFEYGSGTPGGHGGGDHAHGNGEAHEHATGAGLCGTRYSPHFTQDVSIGWTVTANGRGPRLSLQLDVENLSNEVHLLSKESTMVQGQYSTPRVFSGSVKVAF